MWAPAFSTLAPKQSMRGTTGGGKRDVHSAERYDRATGISVFESPSVKPGRQFLYFDPIAALDPEHQWRWTQPAERRAMIDAALAG